jgi:Tfp pilus assembly protein PilV
MRQRGFTFVEVLIILLVIVIGLLGVAGLVAYGTSLVTKVNANITGLATAMSVATDAQPYLDPNLGSEWTYSPYPLSGAGQQTSVASGFINGFYVVRTETSAASDVIATGRNAVVYARSANVSVQVYDTFKGRVVASFVTRIVRQKGTP